MDTTGTASAHDLLTASAQPLVLEPVLVERIWGTDTLAPWYAGPAPQAPTGEIWLTAENCRVASGPAAGQTLAKVTASAPQAFGDVHHNGFPLLLKLLFPREKLSVQVHPNDAEAQLLGMPRGKTECWYVLSAEPGAQVAVGFRESLTPTDVKDAILDGTLESKLRMLPVQAGDMVYVDAGTVHAIGPGMVVLETQQYSDTTYRLWDYGRPRELHVEAGTEVAKTQTDAGLVAPQPRDGYTRLVESPYFAVDRLSSRPQADLDLGFPNKLQILIAIDDGCVLTAAGQPTHPLPRAKAVILPATETSYTLQSDADARIIRVLQP